jgi:glutathionylspermidine synthase
MVDGIPKMLEYNADTPTSLIEVSSVQREWARYHNFDQFNNLDKLLKERWELIGKEFQDGIVYFASVKDNIEDEATAKYMMKIAENVGLSVRFIFIEDIAFDEISDNFVGMDDNIIKILWKLYPWEWLIKDDFFQYIDKLTLNEPAWKLLLSNKMYFTSFTSLFSRQQTYLTGFLHRRRNES